MLNITIDNFEKQFPEMPPWLFRMIFARINTNYKGLAQSLQEQNACRKQDHFFGSEDRRTMVAPMPEQER